MRRWVALVVIVGLAVGVWLVGVAAADGVVESWTDQFGTTEWDRVESVAIAADGSIYVAGTTDGDLEGTNAGPGDGFVRKYDSAGNVVWTRQFGTTAGEGVDSVAIAADGSVYVAGSTGGDLEGTNAGFGDGFVRKYDSAGNVVWTHQFGTTEFDGAVSVADGGVYVGGDTWGDLKGTNAGTSDGFLRRLLRDCVGPMPHPYLDAQASFASDDIGCLDAIEVTSGTTAATYSPAQAVTREQMAAFMARLYRTITGETCGSAPTQFGDVAGSFAYTDIGCILDLGITEGTIASTYSPAQVVSREQMAAFLARFWRALDQTCPTGPNPFTDTGASFAAADIACLYHLDITGGTTATTYSPADTVTREQMAAFLARLYRTAIA